MDCCLCKFNDRDAFDMHVNPYEFYSAFQFSQLGCKVHLIKT